MRIQALINLILQEEGMYPKVIAEAVLALNENKLLLAAPIATIRATSKEEFRSLMLEFAKMDYDQTIREIEEFFVKEYDSVAEDAENFMVEQGLKPKKRHD